MVHGGQPLQQDVDKKTLNTQLMVKQKISYNLFFQGFWYIQFKGGFVLKLI